MQWSNDVMGDEFKVLVSDPLFDIPLATSEEVINNGDFMTHQHQSINQV